MFRQPPFLHRLLRDDVRETKERTRGCALREHRLALEERTGRSVSTAHTHTQHTSPAQVISYKREPNTYLYARKRDAMVDSAGLRTALKSGSGPVGVPPVLVVEVQDAGASGHGGAVLICGRPSWLAGRSLGTLK